MLRAQPHLDAIIAVNDVMALAAMKAVQTAGRAVPADVAVAGFDDFAFSAFLQPALTTVRVSGYDMGRTAAELLLARLKDGAFPSHEVVFPTTLIVRDST